MKTMKIVMSNDEIMKLVELAISLFVKKTTQIENDRYKSWEYCYHSFISARNSSSPDYDILSLHLAFYLASWGMYRGSSFLLQKDYKIHTPIVKELLKSDYDELAGKDWSKASELDNDLSVLEKLKKFINDYYAPIRKDVATDVKNNENVSEVFITKILMGTLGCTPAYDRYFKAGIKSLNVSTGNFNKNSTKKLIWFYTANSDIFEQLRNSLPCVDGSPIKYPEMKLVDMGFWLIGYAIEWWKENHKDETLPSLTYDFVRGLLLAEK